MGINKLYGLVKEMNSSAGIDSDKRFTNHSMRKHLVQRLSDAGVPANQITQISGYKNVNSINNYSKINNNQNRNISSILTSADKPTILPIKEHHSASQTITQTLSSTHNQTISSCQSRIDSDIRSTCMETVFRDKLYSIFRTGAASTWLTRRASQPIKTQMKTLQLKYTNESYL
ncbi:uncharacterized protein LOC134254116 [Saccostrea cucullata]|uniref:uncharacterized protein LOC134254116 n=1 Tax=Saccostrea cuccullata TaxID=36930 RepID=UPI002ED63974